MCYNRKKGRFLMKNNVNDVKNRLVFEGEQRDIDALFKIIGNKKENRIIDFCRIIPYPEDLYMGPITAEALSECGSYNWYDFNKSHWGTYYNAYEAERYGNILDFLTAWRHVDKIVTRLSKLFPTVEITYKWAARERGGTIGSVKYSNGAKTELILENGEVEKLYDSLW